MEDEDKKLEEVSQELQDQEVAQTYNTRIGPAGHEVHDLDFAEEPKEEPKEEQPTGPADDPDKMGGFYPGGNYLLGTLENTMQGLSSPGLGMFDFGMDTATTVIPGTQKIDTAWDKFSQLDNPIHTAIRNFSSIVIPSLYGGHVAQTGLLSKLPVATNYATKARNALVAAGVYGGIDAAIIGLSDIGEEHNALRALSDLMPGVFGPKGAVPIAEWAMTLDSDSSSVRKWKNMFDSAGLSIISTLAGALIAVKGSTKKMGWFQPLDDSAAAYKKREIAKNADPKTLMRIQQINEVLSTGQLSKQNEQILMDELMTLEQGLASIDDVDDVLRQTDEARLNEQDTAGVRKVKEGKTDFDPDITPILTEDGNARQTTPPGNIARNIADTTAIKTGISTGDPAPVITESMRSKGLMVGSTSRDAVMGVAEEARDLGRFDALVDGFRFTAKQMNAAAWDIYTSIIAAENMDDVRGLFIDNKAIQPMLLGKFDVEYINEEQARAAAFALRDLTDRYLGRSVSESSARVMDTLGREASTIAESIQKLEPVIDSDRAMDLIIDKMQFLLDEYALNKYISGWQLRNKNWFDQVPPKDIDTVIGQLTEEFRSAENAIHAKNLRFTKTLKELAETNPAAMRPLVDAFAHTNGDVDTITKLMKWTAEQVTPTGMLKSPDPEQLNLFTRSAWGVAYNNVLSGISALRALQGSGGLLTLRPINAIIGHGVWGLADDFEGLKRAFYYHGAVYETNRRALKDAFTMMKKAYKEPELMIQAYRKDFLFQEDKAWDILEDMRAVWEQEENYGRILQLDMALMMRDLAKHPHLRYGMTAMTFVDAFTNTHVAHYLSRMRAYDDVFTEFGWGDPSKLAIAEKRHYAEMFDANGLIKDKALKSLSGEIALNLDDGLATWINKGTTAYPIAKHLFMFPRTGSNAVRNALSWQPISLIPGINKYSKTIWARTDEDIAAALAEHGIDMAATPNAKELWKNLRAEYTGRIAFGSLLTKTLWDYAMAGNIRGNGHYNAGRRTKERDQMGYTPKTINLGGKWVSYKGFIGVDQVLSILGDMAYYANDIDQSLLEDWQAKLMWTISASFLNETPLQGLEPLVAAASGDLSGWSRLAANSARTWIPMSGAQGVLSNMITSSQKDLSGEIHEYIMNRTPFLSSLLPEQIDIWTGQPLNDLDNPFLRTLNAVSPVKISGTAEPWRMWLLETGWDGLGRLKKDSTGSYTYSTEERERIYKYMGEEQMYKELIPLMKSKKFKDDITQLRNYRVSGDRYGSEKLRLKTKYLPVHQLINKIVKTAQKKAELRLLEEARNNPELSHIPLLVRTQRIVDEQMKQGDVEGAAKTKQETQELLQMSK